MKRKPKPKPAAAPAWPGDGAAVVDYARYYMVAHNWTVVPISFKEKGPKETGWHKWTITLDTIAKEFAGPKNIGVQLGPRSNNLVDSDLDCPEAMALADYFLPPTPASFGRASKPQSHRLYYCSDPPDGEEVSSLQYHDDQAKMIVELRLGTGSKAAQTLFPGSVHPSGEVIAWEGAAAEPAHASYAELAAATVKIAVGALLMRHWPPKGSRHKASLVIGGFLARAGWDIDTIKYFVEAVAKEAGDPDPAKCVAAARDSAENFVNGEEHIYGLPALQEVFGEAVANKIAKHIGYSADFEVNKEGHPVKASQRNIRKAVEMLGITVSYDAFHDQMLITGLKGHRVLNDSTMERLWLMVDEKFKLLPNREFFWTVISDLARYNSFHPVRDYLDGLQWDGIARLDNWLVKYGGVENTAYARAVSAITLIAAVRRVRQPGCKFDEMLILESPQGADKSSMLACIAVKPDWFSDEMPLNVEGRKVIEQLRGRWIIEAADLSGMRKADVEHLKAFLSRQVDRARLAYGRITTDQPRQCVVRRQRF